MVKDTKASINVGDFRLDLSYSANSPDSYIITGFAFVDNKTEKEIKPSSPRGRLLNLEGIYPKLDEAGLPQAVKDMALSRLHALDRSSDFVQVGELSFQNYHLTAHGTKSRFNASNFTFAYVRCVDALTLKEVEVSKLSQPVLTGFYKEALKLEDDRLKLYLTSQLKQHIKGMKQAQEY